MKKLLYFPAGIDIFQQLRGPRQDNCELWSICVAFFSLTSLPYSDWLFWPHAQRTDEADCSTRSCIPSTISSPPICVPSRPGAEEHPNHSFPVFSCNFKGFTLVFVVYFIAQLSPAKSSSFDDALSIFFSVALIFYFWFAYLPIVANLQNHYPSSSLLLVFSFRPLAPPPCGHSDVHGPSASSSSGRFSVGPCDQTAKWNVLSCELHLSVS